MRHGVHRLRVRVVKEENAAQLLPGNKGLHRFDARLAGPIHAVDGPQHDVRTLCARDIHSTGVIFPVRRPDVPAGHPELAQRILNADDLRPLFLLRKITQRTMGLGVIADLVAFLLQADHEVRVVPYLLADKKKGRPNTAFPQDAHEPLGMGPGAIVKGQGAEIAPLAHLEDGSSVHNRSRFPGKSSLG